MKEITYLPEIECEIKAGFLVNELAVAVADERGNRQHLRVNQHLVAHENGKHYLAIGIVELDLRKKRALVELPHEADSGANRLWVPFISFRRDKEPA